MTTASTTINGPEGTNGLFGAAIAAGSDFNADGYADLAVGAPGVESDTGRVYVFMGSPSGLSTVPSVTLRATGISAGRFGETLTGIGDTNGDGFPDLLVGAPAAGSNTGAAFIFPGSATGLSSAGVRLSSPAGAGERFGVVVAQTLPVTTNVGATFLCA